MKIDKVNVPEAIESLVVASDSHSVGQALVGLEQSLANLPGRSQMVFAGDMLGGGVDTVQMFDWICAHARGGIVRGNHDALTSVKPKLEDGNRPGSEGAALAVLSPEGYQFIQQLPEQINICWRGKKIRIMHGHQTPDGKEEVSWLATPAELTKIFADPDFDLTVTGHTHYPFLRRDGDHFIANAGTMACPIVTVIMEDGTVHSQAGDDPPADGGDFRSNFLLVTEQAGELEVEIVRFDYDRQAALDHLAKIEGLPQPIKYWQKLITTGVADLRIIYA